MTHPRRPARLLWLLRYPCVPPSNGGDAVYLRELITHVSDLADTRLLSFSAEGLVPDPADKRWHIVPLAKTSKVLSVLSPLPNIAYRFRQEDYRREAIQMAREVDGIIVDNVGLFSLVAELRAALGADCPPMVLINHNHEGSLRAEMARATPNPVMRAVLQLDGAKAARLERTGNRTGDGYTAITTTDLDAFGADAPGVPGLLLMPGYDGPILKERVIDASTPERLCILGARSAYHKLLVLRQILDAVVESGLHRRMIVDVVGGDREGDPKYAGVNFLGYVDDLEGYLRTVRLGLIPDDIGGGFKLRALTHIFQRVPMLALSKAMRGMTLRDNVDFAAVEDIPAMVAATEPLLRDTARLDSLQREAFASCRDRFSWQSRAENLLDFFGRLRQARAIGPARSAA